MHRKKYRKSHTKHWTMKSRRFFFTKSFLYEIDSFTSNCCHFYDASFVFIRVSFIFSLLFLSKYTGVSNKSRAVIHGTVLNERCWFSTHWKSINKPNPFSLIWQFLNDYAQVMHTKRWDYYLDMVDFQWKPFIQTCF